MSHRLPATAVLALALFGSAHATEILHWERLPLAVPLVVGQERVVFVDRNVRIGVPPAVGARLRVQSAAGAIYLRANEPIEPTRLQLQDADTGSVILLDIVAEPVQRGQPPLEPVRILESPSADIWQHVDDQRAGDVNTAPAMDRQTPVPVILTRYAAQSLYAPLRTVEPVPGIARVNLRRDLALNTLLLTLPVRAQALAAWRLDDLWVSAVRLHNTTAHWLDLDPRALQGAFAAATFQHGTLGPSGTPEDTTVVYLITRGYGLAQALLPASPPSTRRLTCRLRPIPTTKTEAAMHSNGLLKWLMIPMALVLLFIGLKIFSGNGNPPAPQQADSRLTPEEAKTLGIEGDTPRDTVATLVAQVRQLRTELQTALSDNKAQREENERLRQREGAIDRRIQSALEQRQLIHNHLS
jgi:integrating conjugative element protein (TIGR03749 family)